jgi:hypothetical protein
MMRFAPFAFAVFVPMLVIPAGASPRQPMILAELQEESIPAQDLGAPSSPAAAAPSPAVQEGPDSDDESQDWQQMPAGRPPATAQTAPTQKQAPSVKVPAPPTQASAPATSANAQSGQPAAAPDIAPAIDVGSIATTPQISDASLTPMIDTAPTPARAASLRITEAQRVALEQGHTDNAIRELAYAVSIDPSNSYAYFFLGRAYVARRDYGQAETFFKRAEIGLASNSAWLGEAYAFEGLSLEQAGKSAEAAAAYQKALAASPGNLTARVGVTRVGAVLPASATTTEAAPDLIQPPPAEPDAPGPPEEAPAPPPPTSATPPTD